MRARWPDHQHRDAMAHSSLLAMAPFNAASVLLIQSASQNELAKQMANIFLVIGHDDGALVKCETRTKQKIDMI